VIPGLIRRFHEAKTSGQNEVRVWGTGSPLREFLHVDDLARASVFLLENYNQSQFLNVGSGEEISIKELAELIARVIGFEGRIAFDPSKPDGTPRKVMECSKIRALGWAPKISLEAGLRHAYLDFTSRD
jgi:GDP-L-fucose synthase